MDKELNEKRMLVNKGDSYEGAPEYEDDMDELHHQLKFGNVKTKRFSPLSTHVGTSAVCKREPTTLQSMGFYSTEADSDMASVDAGFVAKKEQTFNSSEFNSDIAVRNPLPLTRQVNPKSEYKEDNSIMSVQDQTFKKEFQQAKQRFGTVFLGSQAALNENIICKNELKPFQIAESVLAAVGDVSDITPVNAGSICKLEPLSNTSNTPYEFRQQEESRIIGHDSQTSTRSAEFCLGMDSRSDVSKLPSTSSSCTKLVDDGEKMAWITSIRGGGPTKPFCGVHPDRAESDERAVKTNSCSKKTPCSADMNSPSIKRVRSNIPESSRDENVESSSENMSEDARRRISDGEKILSNGKKKKRNAHSDHKSAEATGMKFLHLVDEGAITDTYGCIKFLRNHRLLAKEMNCSKCTSTMWEEKAETSKQDGYRWRCRRPGCGTTTTIRRGSFFEESDAGLIELTLATYFWSMDMLQQRIAHECGLSERTVEAWAKVLRKECSSDINNEKQIGGPGISRFSRILMAIANNPKYDISRKVQQ